MAAGDPYPEWIRRFVDQQSFELKPWIRCDGTGRYPYIEVVESARDMCDSCDGMPCLVHRHARELEDVFYVWLVMRTQLFEILRCYLHLECVILSLAKMEAYVC